ncbi:MAG: peptidylprolyl isomerase [Bacteroidota bacterium]
MKRFLLNILSTAALLFCFSIYLHGQSSKEIIARAGNISITKDEFTKRYEMMAHPNPKGLNEKELKKEFVYTLLAEKLLAQSQSTEEIAEKIEFRALMDYMRGNYLRDYLYKKEVKDKIAVPDSEMVEGYQRSLKSFRVKFIFSNDEKEITEIYSSLINGASFDSILQTRSEYNEQKESAKVTLGSMAPEVENEIYKLSPGRFTPPVELEEGWYICKVYEVETKKSLEQADISNMKKVLESRTEDRLYSEFYRKFFKGVNVNTDRPLFDKLAKAFLDYLQKHEKDFVPIKTVKFRFTEKELGAVINDPDITDEERNKAFIKFESNPITFGRFLQQLRISDIGFQKIEEQHVRNILNSFIYSFIQNELLIRESIKRGYDNIPEVANELKYWKEYYLAHEVMKKIFREQNVSDEDALEFFTRENKIVLQPDSVKLLEILLPDLNRAEEVLTRINNGEDFKELAAQFTIREELKAKKGEYDYFPVTEKGELGIIASTMKIGDVYGPVKMDEGYLILKLVDKKEGKKKQYKMFEEAKEEIKNILKTEKMYTALDNVTARLAEEKGIRIYEPVLESAKVTNVNMVVLRRFGFGGQTLAVPFTPHYSSWLTTYLQRQKRDLPK